MNHIWGISIHPITIEVIFEFFAIAVLLLASALVSGCEVAYFSLKPADIKLLKDSDTRKSKMVLKLIEEPEKLLAAMLIGYNLLSITIVILSTAIINSLLSFEHAPLVGFIIEVVIVTFAILLFTEIMPKVFATDNAVNVAKFMALPMYILTRIFLPISHILIQSTLFVQKRLAPKNLSISVNDLSNALELTGELINEDKTILEGIVKFGSKDVNEVMRPRVDVVAVEHDVSINKLIGLIIESGYSRIPVCENGLDNIKGILYTKDLLPYIGNKSNVNWLELVRPAYFVPETKKIDDLLSEFQKNKIHVAIVIDEYGGTSGLVTMEDIIEEIFGEISDESDVDEESLYRKLGNNAYLFEAKILLNDFFKVTGLPDTYFDHVNGEYETLAGLILELKGEIPQKNDKIEINNVVFIIENADNRRIKQLKVVIK